MVFPTSKRKAARGYFLAWDMSFVGEKTPATQDPWDIRHILPLSHYAHAPKEQGVAQQLLDEELINEHEQSQPSSARPTAHSDTNGL